MKRAAAMILAVLMLIQFLPVNAETYTDWYHVDAGTVFHTVRFVADGEEIDSVSVADGSVLPSVPEGPEKTGYLFEGWFADGTAVIAGTVVTADITAEAIYSETDIEGVLYANKYLYLTGKLPSNGIIDVQPVEVSIDGEEVLAAYDIKIYANANQQKKGKTWQPSDKKVQVHFFNDAFEGELNIYHIKNSKRAGPEYIGTVEASDGWVEFDAGSFSTYAVTRAIEQEVTISGQTYRIRVAYDHRAGIPDGAVLDVKEVSADAYLADAASALGCGKDDELFYARFMDLSILYNGAEIEPATPVSVSVELMDVTDGAQALEVVHFGKDGAEKIDAEVDPNGAVTFTAESFSVYGFGSVLHSLLSWEEDEVTYTVQGFSEQPMPAFSEARLELEEGLEAIDAYTRQKTRGAQQDGLYVKVSTEMELEDRENVAVYSIKNGEAGEILAEGQTLDSSVALGDADGFAVVKDSGYRRKIFSLGEVELNGMMPKDAEAEAADVTAAYENFDFPADGGESAGDADAGSREPAADEDSNTDEAQSSGEAVPHVIAAYDISITEGEEKYQPDEAHPVLVQISSNDIATDNRLMIWHIRDDGSMEQVTDFTVEEGFVSFTAAGFSVYVVVDAPEPASYGDAASSVSELTSSRGANGFYLSVARGTSNDYYFQSTVNGNGALVENTDISQAAVWFFEPVEGTDNQFRICTMAGADKKYIKQQSAGNNPIMLSDTGSIFQVSMVQNGLFHIKLANENRWLQHSGGGNGIRLWNDTNNTGNSRIKLTFVAPGAEGNDPYGLDGKTYGIMNRKSEISAYGMMSTTTTVNNVSRRTAKEMLIRTDPMNQSNTLYVARDSDLAMWTFQAIEADVYYLKLGEQYLRVGTDGSVTLADEPDDNCRIRVVPGTGNNAGKIRLLTETSQRAVTLSADGKSFYSSNATTNNTWHNLVDYSVYTDDDFVQYSAQKVSVSDGVNVANGKQVVIYTRVWNETDKKYEFYAIDHNGDLLPCYESGDSIVWIGTRINTLLWDFTEYYTPGTTVQNGYYELRNAYTGKYIAPQISGGQIFADGLTGINLNGRLYGDYYTTILSWDDSHYDYAGYKVENGKIVSCPMSQADTFYFAVMDKTEHELTPVETVDHNALGLTMKMIDCPSREYMKGILGNDEGGMGTALQQGILSTGIPGDSSGYPTTTSANRSLSDLYSGATSVNHLFIKSIYEGSGYFQFDSSENFAELNGGQFTVYKELGSVKGVGKTHSHGQFMPYNTLTGNVHADNPYNMTDIYGNPLSDNYPRKYEPLYAYEELDNSHFAMELTGHFMQPPNGHDAWGHDIIFEFVGDDDFWLYVDGELVIDLGGIHSAVPGSVNYSTGDVYVNGVHTTLRDLFYNNYRNRDGHTDADAQAYVDGLFQPKIINGQTHYVFKDYSAHTIRIFYMERGAGASNLRMRFNLATVTPGQVLLTKELSGTVKQDFASMKFPFQIYYKVEGRDEYQRLNQQVVDGVRWQVVYNNTSEPVEYKESDTINGVTYNNVFYLKPGQTAAIKSPDNTISYYVTECGVDTSIYDQVSVNGTPVAGVTPAGATTTQTFTSDPAAVNERARISFSNHINPSQLRTLTITKKLFDADGRQIDVSEDRTGFTMRLRFGDELGYYNQGDYYVKDPNGCYCRFDSVTQQFASVGVSSFENLTEELLTQVTFRTSPSGAASKLPSGYSIEVRELLVGTRFQVTEEDYDIPVGYGKRTWTEEGTTYYGYKRVEGSYLVDEGDTQNAGVIRDNSNPKIEVHNQRGWGIRANKIWSDADFMRSHDDIYFAVYVGDNLLAGSVRRIDAYNYTTYFFPKLENGANFSSYKVYEVVLTDPVVAPDGTVVSYSALTKLGTADTITIDGINTEGNAETGLQYTPSYAQGTEISISDDNCAVRTDTVTNTRIGGLRIIKTDDQNEALPSAEFTLKQGDTLLGRYTSAADGLVTMVYLADGEYLLNETKAPSGYQAMAPSIRITVSGGQFSVSGGDTDGYSFNSESRTLTIRNAPFTLQAMKIDATQNIPLENAHFALYRQVAGTDGPRKDYYPMEGCEDLVSGADGIIPGIDQSLRAGSYYLTEKQAPEGYELPSPVNEVLFTISETGMITVHGGEGYMGWIEKEGTVYTIVVPNGKIPNADLTIQKTVSGGLGDRTASFGFTLDSVADEEDETWYTWTKTTASGATTYGEISTAEGSNTFTLAHGDSIRISVPMNKDIVLSEENGYYTTTWKLGDGDETTGSGTTVNLTGPGTLAVDNRLDPVAPTGYTGTTLPYIILLSAGALLLAIGRKRRPGRGKGGGADG